MKEAIELLEKARAKGEDKYQVLYETGGFDTSKYHLVCSKDYDQALAILEQPKCKTCGFTPETRDFYKDFRPRDACPDCQQPKDQPSSEFTKELRQKLSDSCCAIIEDVPGWRSLVADARAMSFEACKRLDTSEASRKELLEALKKYGRHGVVGGDICEKSKHSDYNCTCGFEAAIAKAEK